MASIKRIITNKLKNVLYVSKRKKKSVQIMRRMAEIEHSLNRTLKDG